MADEELIARLTKGDAMDGRTVNCKLDMCNCAIMDEAAYRLRSLLEERERLREALDEFLSCARCDPRMDGRRVFTHMDASRFGRAWTKYKDLVQPRDRQASTLCDHPVAGENIPNCGPLDSGGPGCSVCPRCVAETRASENGFLRERIGELEAVLSFYASEDIGMMIGGDQGRVARKILSKRGLANTSGDRTTTAQQTPVVEPNLPLPPVSEGGI